MRNFNLSRYKYDAYGGLASSLYDSEEEFPLTQEPCGFDGQFGYYTDVEVWAAAPQAYGYLGRNSEATAYQTLLGHRYYDPSTARFLNRDPTRYSGGMKLCSILLITVRSPLYSNVRFKKDRIVR